MTEKTRTKDARRRRESPRILSAVEGGWTRGYRRLYLAAAAAMALASCFLYLVPLVPQVALDGVLSSRPDEASPFVQGAVRLLGGRGFLLERLWVLAALVAALAAIAGGFTYLRKRWAAAASEGVVRRLRERVYDHLQRLPCRYLDEAETGDLLQRCTSDVETLRLFLATQVVEIARAALLFLVPIPLMLALDVRMTLVSMALLPVITAFSLVRFRRIKRACLEKEEAEGGLTARLQENLTGVRVVRAFARQDHECERFDEKNARHRRLDDGLYQLLASFWSVSDLLVFGQKGLVVAAGAYWLATGSLAVGAYFYFLTASSMFVFPVRQMGRILAEVSQAQVAADRLLEVLRVRTEDDEDEGVVEAWDEGGSRPWGLSFEGVTLRHGARAALDGLDLEVAPGETVAILGPPGSGKTTLVSLLLRLYGYQEGSVRVNGRELRSLPRAEVRSRIACVMQEPFLYSKSLRQNLAMSRPHAAWDEVLEAASVACIHESIERFEQGYETVVGERGVTLSGGQRQRVALARALLQRPALLILDDALSAVDVETEARILRALLARKGRQTTIVIAHRVSTLRHADRVCVLERGRLVQQGTHEELLREEGLYRRLVQAQEDGLIEAGARAGALPQRKRREVA